MLTPIIGADFSRELIRLVDGAKKNIDIVLYDWRWYRDQNTHPVQQVNAALVRARQRGVLIRAVLNSPDLIPVLRALGIEARRPKNSRTVHTKLFLIDGHTVVIGSHNLTRNALSHNIETSVAIEAPGGLDRFQQFFENLFIL